MAVWSETLGPGDDIRLEFEDSQVEHEAQIRHGMTAGAKLDQFVKHLRETFASTAPTPVALVVGRNSSAAIGQQFAEDLDRLRDGREDNLGPDLARLLKDPANRSVLEQVFVIEADLDRDSSALRMLGVDLLRRILAEERQAEAGWDVLVADGLSLSAREGRRTADALNNLLTSKRLALKDVSKDPVAGRLELIQELLEEGNEIVVLDQLKKVEAEHGTAVSKTSAARIARMRSIAHLRLKHVPEALASAREAIRMDPDWADAYAAAARAAADSNDAELARSYVQDALKRGHGSARAWAAAVLVASQFGDPAPEVPSQLRENWEVAGALAFVAGKDNDASAILAATTPVLSQLPRRSGIWLLHAHAKFLQATEAPTDTRNAKLREVDAEVTDLIRSLRIDHRTAAPAFLLRHWIRQELGQASQAEADLRRAEDINDSNNDLLANMARLRLSRHDREGALRSLRKGVVDQDAQLLALRSAVLASSNKPDEARADLDRAESVLQATQDQDAVRQIARSAVLLKDIDRAKRMFDLIDSSSVDNAEAKLLAGEIAFLSGNAEEAIHLYREAIDRSTGGRIDLIIHLGSRLSELRRFRESQAALDEIGIDQLPVEVLEDYTVVAGRAGDFVAVQAALDRATASATEPPIWTLGLAADLALRREDFTTAAKFIEDLERRGELSPHNRLVLVALLISLDRVVDADRQLDQALLAELSPNERLMAAQLLFERDRKAEAVEQVYRAHRSDRGNPKIQQALVSMAMMSGGQLLEPSTSRVGTHITLRRDDGKPRDHTIVETPPFEPGLGEFDLATAEREGLVGLRVGDIIERNAGHWSGYKWTVEKILPAAVHAAHQIMDTFEDNFPDEQPAFRAIRVVNESNELDLTRVIGVLSEGQTQTQRFVELYKNGDIATEALGALVPHPVPALMRELSLRPFTVEWPERANHAQSIMNAQPGRTVVLTRTGLATAYRFGLLNYLKDNFTLIAPNSLKAHLRQELASATDEATTGRSRMLLDNYQPRIIDVQADDPRLVAARDEAEKTLEWLEQNAHLEPRPLPALNASNADPRLDVARLRFGPSAFDALVLAESGKGALFADDLVLRRMRIEQGPRVPSFSTVALLEALTNAGCISAGDRDALLVDLVLAGYTAISPTLSLLEAGMHRMPGIGREGLQAAFSTLGTTDISLRDAADIGTLAIKSIVTKSVQLVSIELITELVVRSVAARTTLAIAAQVVARAASSHLRLLPPDLNSVEAVCARLAAEACPSCKSGQFNSFVRHRGSRRPG